MHIHYLALKKIAAVLSQEYTGFTVIEAFSQQKDELVFGLASDSEEFFLRVACAMPLPAVWPVKDYRKAKRNVVNLFPAVLGKDLLSARAVPWERVLILEFESGLEVVLKMHGGQSNILLRREGEIIEIFRQQKAEDLSFREAGGVFSREAAPTTVAAPEVGAALKNISPALDRNFAEWATHHLDSYADFPAVLDALLTTAENDQFFIRRKGDRLQFLLFEMGESVAKTGILEAMNFFFRNYFVLRHYTGMYNEISRLLAKPLKKLKGQEASYWRNLENLDEKRSDEELGSILMANLHALKQGPSKVELYDFYNDCQITIKLKPELNPQQNAQTYYLKQKKRKSKRQHLEGLIEGLQDSIDTFETLHSLFEGFPAPKDLVFSEQGFEYSYVKGLQKFQKQHGAHLVSGKQRQKAQQARFMEFEHGGYKVYVGRNSKNNDELSFHYAKKDDLWLHAKDVAGSHVIIRNPGGKPVPTAVLEYAASLAAYFSKRKNEELVPVTYTPRKYIRKTRHLAAGEVLVDREEVLLIEPRPF